MSDVRSPNIYRALTNEDVVQRLCSDKVAGINATVFPTIRELLCFAALLGFSKKRRIPLDRSSGVEDVSYQQFERGNAEDLIYMIALAEEKDADILREGRERDCADIFEEYANGGLLIIKDWLLRRGGEYPHRALIEGLQSSEFLKKDGDIDPNILSTVNF